MNRQEKIEQALARFKLLQDRQIGMLSKGCDSSAVAKEGVIKDMVFERSRTFEDLRNEISIFSGISKARDKPAFLECRLMVSEILEKEKILTELVKERKEKLTRDMETVRRGKKTLRGYRGGADTPGRSMELTG
ncbi:MAG: hypothetical protein RBR67_00535 [Desulfobacterium sp.]|jgi:hypothetical protein|nr:hypothetical protein [Desulfobacterium sp.]